MALTSFAINRQLKIASAFASRWGYDILQKRKKGVICSYPRELRVLNGLITCLERYGRIYVQPTIQIGITALTNGAVLRITIGTENFGNVTFNTNNAATARQILVDFINAQNKLVVATLGTTDILLTAQNGSAGNGMAYSSVVVSGSVTQTLPFPEVFLSTGTDYFSENAERCLEDNEVETIVYKIKSYIDKPCSTFINC